MTLPGLALLLGTASLVLGLVLGVNPATAIGAVVIAVAYREGCA